MPLTSYKVDPHVLAVNEFSYRSFDALLIS